MRDSAGNQGWEDGQCQNRMSSWLPGEPLKKKCINNISVLSVEERKGESYVQLDTLPTDQKLFPSGISF